MLQRHAFVKGYLATGQGSDQYIRVEESYAGDLIEIYVGNDEEDTNCTCECGCAPKNVFGIDLTHEQVKELMFCLKQLHFIDPRVEK